MLNWLKSALKVPQPSGPCQPVRSFGPDDATITHAGLASEENAWGFEVTEKQSIPLFEVENPGVDQCMVTYRARMRSQGLSGRAYLEMWCRFPGRGEFFSKGIHQTLKGTRDWASYETPFFLRQGEMPDLIKLNVMVEGTGRIWIKDVELLKTPLA